MTESIQTLSPLPSLENVPPEVVERLEQLESLYNISLDVFSAKNMDELLIVVISRVTRALKADRSTLFILDKEKDVLWSKVAQGVDPIVIPSDAGIAGWVAQRGEKLNIPEAYEDDRFNPAVDKKTGYRTKSILCIPVKNREDEVVAVVQAINKEGGPFDEKDEQFLYALSAQVQLAIENSTLYQELKDLFESMMESMALTIDARHPTTAGHTMRVRQYSLEIAREMGFVDEMMDLMNYAALLHDYGKIGVPESVLTKPGRLTDEEYDAMKAHAQYTIDILSKIRFARRLKDIPFIAGHHHEKVDGTGYPHGLTGEEMHPLSRIMAVADVFDAMTSIRDYRRPADPDKVLDIIKGDVGKHFDADCVAAFERYYKRDNLGDAIRFRNECELAARAEKGEALDKLPDAI